MSLKGFKKTLVRAPQTFRQKMNMGEVTTDAVYQDAERRFKELENETKKLSSESKRYFSAVNGMLDYQIDFSTAIEEIYKPISGRLSDPNGAVPEDNPEGIKASEQYREVVKELKESLKPDLELIEKRIVNPAQELLQVIQLIRKMATKREHKQVDLDRCKRNYTKYEEKKERTAKDEERMYTAQADLDVAQQEYDYYNDMLKAELPIMFQMQSDFIKPLFVSFYYMQLNIFYTLYSRMEEMKIPYFDLTTDIVEAYVLKKGNIEEQCDSISVTNFKVGRAKQRLDATKRRHAGLAADGTGAPGDQLPTYTPGQYGQYGQQPPAAGAYGQPPAAAYGQPPAAAYGQPPAAAYGQPPAAAYGQPPAAAYGQPPAQYGDYKNPQGPGYQAPAPAAAPTYGSPIASPVATGYAAPAPVAAAPTAQYALPTPAPSAGAQTCTALYDYTAQAQGDLTFAAGAVIEVVEKTVDTNGWWTGKYNGQTGVFPGNYVQLN